MTTQYDIPGLIKVIIFTGDNYKIMEEFTGLYMDESAMELHGKGIFSDTKRNYVGREPLTMVIGDYVVRTSKGFRVMDEESFLSMYKQVKEDSDYWVEYYIRIRKESVELRELKLIGKN